MKQQYIELCNISMSELNCHPQRQLCKRFDCPQGKDACVCVQYEGVCGSRAVGTRPDGVEDPSL